MKMWETALYGSFFSIICIGSESFAVQLEIASTENHSRDVLERVRVFRILEVPSKEYTISIAWPNSENSASELPPE